jgi:hypothetical protein
METTEKVYVGIDGVLVELTGADLTAFQEQRTKDQAEADARQAEADAKEATRSSALAKLSALGLTPEEIASL